MNVFLNLQGLIRGVRDDEIRGKNLLKLGKFLIDRLTKLCDLLLIAHVDRQRDCAAALPFSSWVLPSVIVQIGGRSLIAGKNLDQIPQINGRSSRSLSDSDFPNGISAFELARRIDDNLSLVGLECASRRNDVANIPGRRPGATGLASPLLRSPARPAPFSQSGQKSYRDRRSYIRLPRPP